MTPADTPVAAAKGTPSSAIHVPPNPVIPLAPTQPGSQHALHALTTMVAAVVALSFLFGLGNVWALGIRLGVPPYIAPLVAPAVDLSVVALLVASRQLALAGASRAQIRPAQRLLIFCSLVTLALNTAEPIIEGHYGRAAFDAVGCCLLIGWSHIAPDLLQSLQAVAVTQGPAVRPVPAGHTGVVAHTDAQGDPPAQKSPTQSSKRLVDVISGGQRKATSEADLIRRARVEDARHWETHHRPISAETLRKRLHVGAGTARRLVAQLRDDSRAHLPNNFNDLESVSGSA